MSVAAGERRIVSVLVADIAGSTAIAERLGPERSKFLFDDVVSLMREEVERLGGTVAQLTGDGLLALFGAPTAHEDDTERAARAALAIHEALARYAAEIGPAYGIELSARIAVNTGPVVVPSRDAPPDELYNALGDTVNVAARLQSFAGDSGVTVGPETARQLEAGFELTSFGELELKGRASPVAAFRIDGEREQPVSTQLTPLIGREVELAQLEAVLLELLDGRGAIVAMTGEAGIGKSRLKSEARERFRDRVRFLEGHAVSYAEAIPYWPLRELLRDWLGLGVSDPEARVRLELRAALARALGDEASDAYPFLAGTLGLPLEREAAARLAELSRDSVQERTFDAVYRLACALAAELPLCLVFEDLHWADEATLALLEQLLAASEEEAIAVVLSFRTEHDHGAWDLAERAHRRFRHRFLELPLVPLGRDAAVVLAARAAGAELPASVASVLAERSGGNPFFLEEAFRDLLERGVLRRENGRYELANGADDVAVPMLVQEALQARLDRLAAPTVDVISVASVVGRSFSMPLLEQIVAHEELRPALSELQRLDLVVEERRRPAPEYRFRHGLVQEVAYGRLVGAKRRDLHRVVGVALEQLHRDSPEEVYGLLAHHFSEADDVARAVDYLLKAGDAARAVYADQEAIELYRRALEFMQRTSDEQRARDTLLKIALTHHLAFDFRSAGEAYGEAFSRRAEEPARVEPSETITASTLFGHLAAIVPGHAYDDLSWDLCRNIFRGLLAVTREFDLVLDLAETMEIRADGREYRFRLRPDARWSDGVPVTAHDFEFTVQRMRDERAETTYLLDDVTDVQALDERTLVLTLRHPRNYFLYLLGQPPFFPWPRHVCEALGPDWHLSRPLVGNGPYTLEEFNERGALLRASQTWWGSRGNVGEVRIHAGRNLEDSASGWRDGHFDLLPHYSAKGLEDPEPTHSASSAAMQTIYVGFATGRAPFDDIRVRRAIAHALDRELLTAEARFTGDPAIAGGLIPPTLPGHSHRVAPQYDGALARDLLAQAGHPAGRGLPRIRLVAPTPFGVGPLADQLAAVGITATIESADFSQMQARTQSANAWVWGWIADFPDPAGMMTILEHFPEMYRDPEIEGLLERARSLRDRDDRLRLYREVERLWIGERVALVPIAYNRTVTYARPWIEGVWSNSIADSTFADITVRPERRSAPTPT